jgi:hypothetical protein
LCLKAFFSDCKENNYIIMFKEILKGVFQKKPFIEWLESQEEYNTKEKRSKIKSLYLSLSDEKLESHLDLSDFSDLEELHCSGKKLTSLNLTNCINLKKLNCSENQLSSLDLSQNIKLWWLWIVNNNFPPENPTWLNHLVNLNKLNLSYNNFTGSLEFTKNMSKLDWLNIYKTNLTTGLEYLPLSLKNVECGRNSSVVGEELVLHGHSLLLWQEVHLELMKKVGKEPVILNYEGVVPEKVTTIPKFLKRELEKNITLAENYNPQLNYSDFLLRDSRPFTWENKSKTNSQKQLPLRLYNLKTGLVETTQNRTDILNYFATSYFWGNSQEKSNKLSAGQKKELDKITGGVDYQNSEKLTKLGYKAWQKAVKVSQLLGTDYFWMDQLCINQNSLEDKGQEVPKMRQYYSQSDATLIAVNAKIGKGVNRENKVELIKHILKKIVDSPWFTRSWTFQEGLLSKQTIFMFDDYLVDGRRLVLAWNSLQKKNYYDAELKTVPQILVTPLGWSYGAKENQEVSLTLGEALLAVKHRKKTASVDGIYSILGLLPYGNEVEVKYEPRFCSKCPNQKEIKGCSHEEENKKWHTYTTEELEQALAEVVKQTINQGHGQEIFSLIGPRGNNFWYLPQVQANGSINVESLHEYQLKNMQISLQGIELESEVHRINKIYKKTITSSSTIKTGIGDFTLVETSKIIPQIQVGDNLVVIGDTGTNPYSSDYICLTFLIPSNPNHSSNLVELLYEIEKNNKPIPQKIFADLVNRRIILGQENIDYYQKLVKDENKQAELTNFLEWNKWKVIHPNFTKELVREWKEKGFTYEQVCEWANAFEKNFYLQEVDFYVWLRDKKKLAVKKCEDEYGDDEIKKSKSELRNQLIIDYWYPNNKFMQSQLYGGSDEKYESFNDLIKVGRTLNWTKIEVVLIREIKVNYDENEKSIRSIQFTYQVKSGGDWKLIQGERHGDDFKRNKLVTIKLTQGEYLTKVEGRSGDYVIYSLAFYTTNSVGETKKYGSYGQDEDVGKKFSLSINNSWQASIFRGNPGNYSLLGSFGIQQTPHQITQEDWIQLEQLETELTAQIETSSKQ